MTTLQDISNACYHTLTEKYASLIQQLDELIESYESTQNQDSETESNESSNHILNQKHSSNPIINLKKEFDRYLRQIPVLGFNSGKYDLNLIKRHIMAYISYTYKQNEIFTIKRNNTYISIAVPDMKFLYITNYLAAGCSYSKFLKAYGCEISKGIFPYEWLDSPSKLDDPYLPPPEAFYSKLSGTNPIQTDEDYDHLKDIWSRNNMKTFKDYLMYYNNLDTGPFVIALTNFIDIYKQEGIDIFKDYVTLPGVARKMLYESSGSKFSLINKENADLYYTMKKNIVGGPSIIFSRYHEKDVTNIKNIDNNLCKAVVGYDCNGLYSYAIKQKMSTGVYIRRFEHSDFRPELSEKYIDSYVWMDFLMKDKKIKILHKLNNSKEIRIGNYLVDGFCIRTKTVYEYNGCYYHHCPHNCNIASRIKSKTWLSKLQKTKTKDMIRRNFLISQGYEVITIQECEFISQIKPKCSKIYDKYLPSYYQRNKGPLSFKKIIKDIKNGRLFGAVEVDIRVIPQFIEKFQEYPPFFCTCNVEMDDIGPHMQQYCKENGIDFSHKRLLISGLKAKKILLATPLLQWYLNNHCEIERIYQLVEYQPLTSFKSFIDTVTMHRIRGDQNPDKAIIGDTYKLLSNSSYRSVLMDRSKHTQTRYMYNKVKVTQMINSPNFKTLEELNNQIFEVESYKKTIVMDNPIQIGFFILQYAKLRMLEFFYDCISKYFIEDSFELTETDTDSIYMAINQASIDECIRSSHHDRYQKEIFKSCSDEKSPTWFPRRCCQRHLVVDGRHVGSYKREWEGVKMVSLCSKSYIIEDANGNQKVSCKGISKKNLKDPMQKFQEALHNKTTIESNNVGFRIRKSDIYTYLQDKIDFNYFYCKREVLADGVSTKPLNITLSPWESTNLVVDKAHHPLSNLYSCEMKNGDNNYHSAEQMFYHLLAKFYNQVDLATKIKESDDPIEIQAVIGKYGKLLANQFEKERIMRFVIMQKIHQVDQFRNELCNAKDKCIIYKQMNLGKNEETFWGTPLSSRLAQVISLSSISGNNLMGQILMEYATKINQESP